MAKPRLFVEQSFEDGSEVTLAGDAHHYLIRVMRQKVGDVIELFNGHDPGFDAKILRIEKRSLDVLIIGIARPYLSPPPLTLAFAPIKKQRTDFIVEKATELGVRAIQPILTDFTNAERVREDRLQRHAIEAVEQCGGTFVPKVARAMPLEHFLKHSKDKLVFCDELAKTGTGLEILEQTQADHWCILIGPEGGFSHRERQLIRDTGALSLSLGPRILRADTAALAAIALWQSIHGDWYHRE